MDDAKSEIGRLIEIAKRSWPYPPGITPQRLDNAKFAPKLTPLKQEVLGDTGKMLWVLMGMIAMVLLIACANVANLVLVRTEGAPTGIERAGGNRGKLVARRDRVADGVCRAYLGGRFGWSGNGVRIVALDLGNCWKYSSAVAGD
ncbi:MAG: hypothetical protein WDO18_14225 [Acidobacteriota bacterium]